MRSQLIFSILCLFLLAGTIFVTASAAKTYEYKVISILDGDTFFATDGNIKFRVRIAAIDAPERDQPYGRVAKHRLSQLLLKKKIQIKSIGKGVDRYGRVLGKITVEGKDVAIKMINAGLATYYRPFCKNYPANKKKYNYDPRAYINAEKKARKLKKNMWSSENTILPCKYRRTQP